ncbi:hypothetical protein C5167_011694 [Papaver somniferum]|uniref:Uncharacterized protein n=1 Tax=Papaver somniferum TaxID=3469 RepID=A0A4Y7K7P0_PAPSO|nr:hypothetical protein C5167_011694 [Papaver somniferum]
MFFPSVISKERFTVTSNHRSLFPYGTFHPLSSGSDFMTISPVLSLAWHPSTEDGTLPLKAIDFGLYDYVKTVAVAVEVMVLDYVHRCLQWQTRPSLLEIDIIMLQAWKEKFITCCVAYF